MFYDFKEDLLEEIEDEHEPEYKTISVTEQISIDLVPMDDVKKALLYDDK